VAVAIARKRKSFSGNARKRARQGFSCLARFVALPLVCVGYGAGENGRMDVETEGGAKRFFTKHQA
jgi:hypothetical protein